MNPDNSFKLNKIVYLEIQKVQINYLDASFTN